MLPYFIVGLNYKCMCVLYVTPRFLLLLSRQTTRVVGKRNRIFCTRSSEDSGGGGKGEKTNTSREQVVVISLNYKHTHKM